MATTTLSPDAPVAELPDGQTVTAVRHWDDQLFSFRVTRPASLRFRSGEFVMIGLLKDDGRPLLRAYSIASPFWDEELEFYSIKVPDGPLTSRLQNIQVGDQVIVKTKPTGTLILDALIPGKRLFLISTGTGIAPFASLIRDPGAYEAYDEVILTHTCRHKSELEYGLDLVEQTKADPLVGEEATEKLKHYATTTREPSQNEGRITDLMRSGKFYEDLGIPALNSNDRVMICGSMALNLDVKDICAAAGLEEGSVARPGTFVVEKSFVGDDTRLS